MLRSAAVKMMPKVIGRSAVRRVGATATGRCWSSKSITMPTRRAFHDYGNPIPEPEFTPAENIMLDVTAWMVGVALWFGVSTDLENWDDDSMATDDPQNPPSDEDRLRREKWLAATQKKKDEKASSEDHHNEH